jgi:hypothetical protein
MSVQLNISAGYLSSFECPLGVSVMSKLTQWPTLQQLGFAGSLTHLNQNFHGLGDFNTQLSEYSSTSDLLEAAWSVIKQIAPKNPQVTALMYTDPNLGQVGKEFQSMTGFGQAFAITPDQLKQPSNISSLVSAGAAVTQSAVSSTVGI